MRIFLIVMFGLALTARAQASCECRCVDGSMQALCSSAIDLPPICPSGGCALPPASIAPLRLPGLPPLGTTQCSERQVLNPATQQYEWHRICS